MWCEFNHLVAMHIGSEGAVLIGLTLTGEGKDQVSDGQGAFAGLLACVQVNAPYRQLVDRYLDLFLHYGINPEIGFDAAVLDRCDREALSSVAGLFAEKDLTVTLHGPFMDLAPGALDEKVRQITIKRLHQTLDLVPLFLPLSVVFHAGYEDRRYQENQEQWLAGSLATWEPLVRRAEELGVLINLENVYEETPEMILKVLENISSDHLGFCLDVGHQNVFGRAPLSEWLDALGPYVRELHLHDNDGLWDEHGPIGSGKVPFAEVFQLVASKDARPLITLEPHEEASLWKSLYELEKLWPWKSDPKGDGTSRRSAVFGRDKR